MKLRFTVRLTECSSHIFYDGILQHCRYIDFLLTFYFMSKDIQLTSHLTGAEMFYFILHATLYFLAFK
jgi:hypothetical protein